MISPILTAPLALATVSAPLPALTLVKLTAPSATTVTAPPLEEMLVPGFMLMLLGGSMSMLPPALLMLPATVRACPTWL